MTKYFRTWRDAKTFIKNAGLSVLPVKKDVWIDYRWEKVWSVSI